MGEDLPADRGRPRDTGEVGSDPIRFLARGTAAVAPKGYKRKARPAAESRSPGKAAVTARLVRRPTRNLGAPKKIARAEDCAAKKRNRKKSRVIFPRHR